MPPGRGRLVRKSGQDGSQLANDNHRRKGNRGLWRYVWNKLCALVLVDLWLAYLADEHRYRDFGAD
jgi:hypothetical protein